MFSKLNRQFDPGEDRHYNIGNKKVRSFKPSGFQSIERLGEGSSMEAALQTQNHRKGRRDDILIIDNKDAGLCLRFGHDVPLSGKLRNRPAL